MKYIFINDNAPAMNCVGSPFQINKFLLKYWDWSDDPDENFEMVEGYKIPYIPGVTRIVPATRQNLSGIEAVRL